LFAAFVNNKAQAAGFFFKHGVNPVAAHHHAGVAAGHAVNRAVLLKVFHNKPEKIVALLQPRVLPVGGCVAVNKHTRGMGGVKPLNLPTNPAYSVCGTDGGYLANHPHFLAPYLKNAAGQVGVYVVVPTDVQRQGGVVAVVARVLLQAEALVKLAAGF